MATRGDCGNATGQGKPVRPPMDPAHGVRTIKLSPREAVNAVTAAEDLFVLAHLGVPHVDPACWTLSIDGLVERARGFTLDALKARPKTVVEAAAGAGSGFR